MGIIYAITDPDGLQYIGATTALLRLRKANHRRWLKMGKHSSRLLQASADKHGVDALSFEAILEVPDKDLLRREAQIIRKLQPALNRYQKVPYSSLKWLRMRRGVDPDAPPYDPSIRQRRTYLVGKQWLTMIEIETQYGAAVVRRVQRGERGNDAIRGRYVHK